jgi:hypothetical protein
MFLFLFLLVPLYFGALVFVILVIVHCVDDGIGGAQEQRKARKEAEKEIAAKAR